MRLREATSFASEHTVEYAVVNATRLIFRGGGWDVWPVFFWRSREGGVASKAVHVDIRARLFAVFPRRPKVYGEKLDRVCWKVNSELIEFAEAAKLLGVPTFAALPVARNLIELSGSPVTRWLRLEDLGQGDRLLSTDAARTEDIGASGMLQNVLDDAKVMPWLSAIDAMAELRSATRTGGHWFGFGGYKPVYFLGVA